MIIDFRLRFYVGLAVITIWILVLSVEETFLRSILFETEPKMYSPSDSKSRKKLDR